MLHRALSPLTVVLAVLAVGCADGSGPLPAEPAAPRLTVGTNTRFPVTFTLPAGRCGLTTTVTGTGEWHAVVRTTEGPNGQVLPIAFSNSAHGTAVGADGTRYVWNYHNNRRRVGFTGTFPFEVHWTDHFVLVGQGGAPDVHTFFNIYFVAGPGGTRSYVRELTIGDPANCDPI
jgi:hypothetical protein